MKRISTWFVLAFVHLTGIVCGDSWIHYGGKRKSRIVLTIDALYKCTDVCYAVLVSSIDCRSYQNQDQDG